MQTRKINPRRCLLNAVFAAFSIMGHVTAQTPTPTPPPTTSVQIINATSVPAISLYVNGRENYPNFPQALLTSDAPIPLLDTRYVAVNKKTGAQAESDVVKFQANANQSLVIMGDFSTQTPPGALPQPDQPLGKTEKPYPPNVVFKVFQHKRMSADRLVRLLVINGMPGKRLKFTAGNDARDILPGESVEFVEQPVFFTYQADAGDQQIAVTVRQSGIMRDAIVIFYLKNGEPAFMRAFENTVLSSPES